MKKAFLTMAAGCCLLLACNDAKVKGVAAEEKAAPTHAAHDESTKEVYRAIQTGDVSKLDNYLTADVIDHEGNMGRDIVGRDSLKKFLGEIHKYFDNLQFDILSQATSADGQYHFSMVRMRGKAKENPWGMPVGMEMDDMNVDVSKIKDGKAAEHWSFSSMKDVAEMMEGMAHAGEKK